jgi:hypothetical protein
MTVELLAKYIVPRSDRTLEQCEDAAGFVSLRGLYVAAVADGAGDAAFSKRWAHCLVQGFLESPRSSLTAGWLDTVGRQFLSEVPFANLPWYLWERLERGVFATFLGVLIDPVRCQLFIVAVGDSCVAWYGDAGKAFYPPLRAGDFRARTVALGYRLGRPVDLATVKVHRRFLRLRPGVTDLFLMTDALAAWYRRALTRRDRPWQVLLTQVHRGTFHSWVERLRAQGELQDDDVTLLALRADLRG